MIENQNYTQTQMEPEVKRYYDKKTKRELLYISPQEMKAQHPNNDYVVTGEVAVGHLDEPGELRQLVMQDFSLHVQPLGTYKNSKYNILGYVPSEYDEYIVLKKKKFPILALLLPLVLLIAVLAGVYFVSSQKTDNGLAIDASAQDYESQLKRPDNIDSSKILIPGYGNFTIAQGSDVLDTVLFNPDDNPCYFQFTLVEESTGEILYQSQLVPPGKGISPIKLSKSFDTAGTYPAILKFKTVDLEDTSITYNGSDIEVNLVVK